MSYLKNVITGGIRSTLNSSTATLASGATYTGTGEQNSYSDVMVTVTTDKDGTLWMEFSPDGTNWDSSISYAYDPNSINPPHVLVKGKRYFRVRFKNTSASGQTYLRVDTWFGQFNKLTSSLNSAVSQTMDATVVRPIDFNLLIAKGLYQGHTNTVKDGINRDIDTGSVPEDVWGGGGTYTGFPATPEEGQIVVAGADTGTVYYSYLAASTDTEYTFGSKAITGAGNYDLGHNIYRCNYAYFDSGSAINVSEIKIRHKVTTTNEFVYINAGEGQSFCAAYSVPSGSSAYVDRITGSIRGGNSGASVDAFFYYKVNGKSPILRFPFVINFGGLYFDDVDYLIKIPELTDIVPRITASVNNNTIVHISYRVVKVIE